MRGTAVAAVHSGLCGRMGAAVAVGNSSDSRSFACFTSFNSNVCSVGDHYTDEYTEHFGTSCLGYCY